MRRKSRWVALTLLWVGPMAALAHQPVMDMAPRWSGGYGFQTRFELLRSTRLAQEGRMVDNPFGLSSSLISQWFEGVYTFDKSVRVTAKLPWHVKTARILKGGQVQDVQTSGVGDLILSLPLKHYVNEQDYTYNIALTPAVHLPTGTTSGELPLRGGATRYQIGLSTNVEMRHVYVLADLFGIVSGRGNGTTKGPHLEWNLDLGYAPHIDPLEYTGLYVMLGSHLRWLGQDEAAEGTRDPNTGGASSWISPPWWWRTGRI